MSSARSEIEDTTTSKDTLKVRLLFVLAKQATVLSLVF